MKINVGTPDRIGRVMLGLLLILLPFATGWALFSSPLWTWGFVVVGAILVVTGVVRFCPAYSILRFSTSKERLE